MIAIGFSAILAALDLLIKQKIEAQPQDTFPRCLPHTNKIIKLQKFHNDGFPFGFMREKFELVQMSALAMTSAVAGVLAYLSMRRGHRLEKLGLSLVLGGAVSNLCDRLIRRYVVDYFTIDRGRLKTVIFNLGDMFVFFGSLLFLLAELYRDLKPVLTAKHLLLYNRRKNIK